jgi:ATP-dependent DNA helicase RecG
MRTSSHYVWMRPEILNRYFTSLSVIPGIASKTLKLYNKLLGIGGKDEARLIHLLLHRPVSLIDRRNKVLIGQAVEGELVTLKLVIDFHQVPERPNMPYRIIAHDKSEEISLTYFRVNSQWLERQFVMGETVLVSGKFERYNKRALMLHPDHVVSFAMAQNMPLLEPVYPLTAGVSLRMVSKAVSNSLNNLPLLPEWQDNQFAQKNNFKSFNYCINHIHKVTHAIDLDNKSLSIRRIAYDEILASQLSIALVRNNLKTVDGISIKGTGALQHMIRKALPYTLTSAQETALAEIYSDMAKPDRMIRLLQGDVGSGKTIVALMAMIAAVEAGFQATLMAPTEVLARQHFTSLEPLARAANLNLVILTGREKGKERKTIYENLSNGTTHIIVGTHALFQDAVKFYNLGLAIIDEQHRFGVHQRLALSNKGQATDLLVMTATPIPRTLVLTNFGDMDVSKLTEKPIGRLPIKTISLDFDRLNDVVHRIGAAIEENKKVYWICPLVVESEEVDATAALARFASLQQQYGPRVELVHGRMSGAEKDAAMARFKSGDARILVATTVVEVGVDVPDATIMVIEHSERFGLSQLHQLRGRIGRGAEASTCVLLYKSPLNETARKRIAIMRESTDGFEIAEEDLKLRGEGEILGTKQSGMPGFKIANLIDHSDLLEAARDDARMILTIDPNLTSQRGQALRILLYLFERERAITLLNSG